MNKISKKLLSLIMMLTLCTTLTVPTSAAGMAVKQVGAGFSFGMALAEDGTLYGFGTNHLGQLGVQAQSAPKPVKITDEVNTFACSFLPPVAASSVHTAGGHSLILKEDGTLYTLGDNSSGQLGVGDRNTHSGLQYVMDDVRAIAAGATASAAVTNDGDLFCWGMLVQKGASKATYFHNSKPSHRLSGVVDVALGGGHLVALKEDGTVWTMGSAYNGALGDGTVSGFSKEFKQVFSGAVAIAAGDSHTLALAADGTLYGWGYNGCGQLGQGFDTTQYPNPVAILQDVKSIECGYFTSHAIKTDHSLWSMGWNVCGQAGIGTREQGSVGTPRRTMEDVAQVSGGYMFTLALKQDGTMYACGNGIQYQFGNNENYYEVQSYVPAGLTAFPILAPGEGRFTDVKSSDYCFDPVEWAVDQGITTGTTVTTFSPNNACTRGQIVTFLYRAMA